jgi:hypothetical protein
MKPMTVEPIVGRGVLFPPGHVRIALSAQHRRAYLLLYGLSFPLADVPALKDRDFDGRSITMSRPQLAALNRNFADLAGELDLGPPGASRDQQRLLTKRFRELQFLS